MEESSMIRETSAPAEEAFLEGALVKAGLREASQKEAAGTPLETQSTGPSGPPARQEDLDAVQHRSAPLCLKEGAGPEVAPALEPALAQEADSCAADAAAQSPGPAEQECGAPPGQAERSEAAAKAPGCGAPPEEEAQLRQALLREQLYRIRMLDPGVSGWEDIFSMPQYGEFAGLVQRGCTPVQAYQLACFEQITARRVASAHRAATLAARGKAHLSPLPAAAGDSFAVPAEVHAQYRAFFPGWSEAQIKADYRRHR